MKKIIAALLLCGVVWADQFNIMGRDLVNPDLTGNTLAPGSGEILSFALNGGTPYTPTDMLARPVFPASTGQADSLWVKSSSESDTQILTIDGLDENWNRKIVTKTLVGQRALNLGGASSNYWRRVNFVSVNTPAVGNIIVYTGDSTHTALDTTDVISIIQVGQAKAYIPFFSTWRDFQGSIQSFSLDFLKRGAGATPDSIWGIGAILARTQADSSWKILYQRGVAQSRGIDVQFVQPIPIGSYTDLYVAAGVTPAATEIVTNLGIGGQ